MEWFEKLERLRDRRSLAQLEQLAGWPLNSLATTIKAKSVPNAKKAIALARAVHVSVEWLFDEAADWPPPANTLPPVRILPWPPNGLTWSELQIAISDYVNKRTHEGLRKLNEKYRKDGYELMIGQSMPIYPEDEATPDAAEKQALDEALDDLNDRRGRVPPGSAKGPGKGRRSG